MSKNTVIFILVVAALLGSVWGGIANKERRDLRIRLQEMTQEMEKLTSRTEREREQVLGKTAGLQETLVERDQQLAKARKELVTLRKNVKALEAEISGCNAAVARLTKEKKLAARLSARKAKPTPAETTVAEQPVLTRAEDDAELRRQLQDARLAVQRLQQQLDAANARIAGLEKTIDEKTDAMTETGQEMDRLKINMDVLLARIGDQQDEIQELKDENRALVKELTAKNEELSDLMEEMAQPSVRE